MADEPVPAPGPARTDEPAEDSGGDPVCWAHLVCPECGAMMHTGHRPGCGFEDDPESLSV